MDGELNKEIGGEEIGGEFWEELWNKTKVWLENTGIKIVIAIVVLIISFIIIDFISRRITRRLNKKKADKHADRTVLKTINNIVRVALKVLVVIVLANQIGIDVTAITAVIMSAGIGLGMAFNGALSNFSGGILILMTRPFKLDDFICALDKEGTVEEIRVCHTKIKTPDNKTIYLPNGLLSTTTIINYTEKGTRRLDLVFPISYTENVNKAREIAENTYLNNENVLTEFEHKVVIEALSSSSVDIKVIVWVKSENYKNTQYELTESIKNAFDAEGIEIPFNQLDVHLKNDILSETIENSRRRRI